MIAYGPVPSRRLGRSLGINNIPSKVCTYACDYCQVGHTTQMRIDRTEFYEVDEVVAAVEEMVEAARASDARIDFLTFVPDGEPTLDSRLGEEIARLRPLGLPIAVISNGSLVDREDVRAELATADWVSLKVDAADADTWRRVDHPHPSLRFESIRQGMLDFREAFPGTLVTETMLVAGVNDGATQGRRIAEFVGRLRPDVAYVAVPTRPPAREGVCPASLECVLRVHQELAAIAPKAELLVGYEGDEFASTGDAVADLLGITAVHPMREQAVDEFLRRSDLDRTALEPSLHAGELRRMAYHGHVYYLRRPKRIGAGSA